MRHWILLSSGKGILMCIQRRVKLVSIKDLQLLLKNIKTREGKLPIEEYVNAQLPVFNRLNKTSVNLAQHATAEYYLSQIMPTR
jgi:hypothetical protein